MKQCYTILNSSNQKQVDEGREYALEKLIEFRRYPLDRILDKLLIDKTTGKRIIWATDGYSEYGENYCDRFEITPGALAGINPVLIQPRAFKALETQQQRTKSKAEVFTPSWIVNKMVNHLDEEWFGRSDVFNIEKDQTWETETEKIDFQGKKWKDYVDRSVLEITCGEAPFIVSRYNATTGEIIPIEERIGILDRKLRIVTENTGNEEDWVKWAKRAYESVYGYEYQGDNLLIGRINLLMTFVDYYQSIWNKEAGKDLLTAITNIITWNFWQMDGLNGTVPLGVPQPVFEQMTLFDIEDKPEEKAPLCKVRKWRAKKTIRYKEIERKEGIDMSQKKFDVVIGNPPYSESDGGGDGSSTATLYNRFVEAGLSLKPELLTMITPARWYSGGKGLDEYRNEMLHNPHLSKLVDFPETKDCFPTQNIRGGVCYFVIDQNYTGDCEVVNCKNGECDVLNRPLLLPGTEVFVRYNKAIPILQKVMAQNEETMDKLVSSRLPFGIPSNFSDYKVNPDDQYSLALYRSDRSIKKGGNHKFFTKPEYVTKNKDLIPPLKVLVSKASPGGDEFPHAIISEPILADENSACTETYLIVDSVNSTKQGQNLISYMKTKFFRFMLALIKNTQNISKGVFRFVPVQDFNESWNDEKLYKKYNLNEEEIEFINSMIKEME